MQCAQRVAAIAILDLQYGHSFSFGAAGFTSSFLVKRSFNTFSPFRSIAMHQIVLPTEQGFIPEHIHGFKSKNDNRKSNLRPATQMQNSMNTKLRTDNTSGVKGVHWREDINKWTAKIWVNKKCISLGCFVNFDDAVKARKIAEDKYFGEFSYEKSQAM